jgi:hypothetical protein
MQPMNNQSMVWFGTDGTESYQGSTGHLGRRPKLTIRLPSDRKPKKVAAGPKIGQNDKIVRDLDRTRWPR